MSRDRAVAAFNPIYSGMLVSRIYSGVGSKMTPPSKIAKNDHISIKFNTHIKNGNLSRENEKNGQNRSKMAKIGPKMAKNGNFHRFLDIFSKFNNFSNIFLTDKFDPGNERFKQLLSYKINT